MKKYEDFHKVLQEAKRFIAKAETARVDCGEREKNGCRSKYLAEAKRASLDLSNALSEFRKTY